MRTIATVALSLSFGLAIAQAPLFSPITLDPTITAPAGDVYALDMAAVGGYSLVMSNANNLTRDSGYGTQMYLVSPQGDAERIPLEKAGGIAIGIIESDAYYDGMVNPFGRISPRGSAALVWGQNGLFAYTRAGKVVRRVNDGDTPVGFISETEALVLKKVDSSFGFLRGWNELYRYNLETGAATLVPLADPVFSPGPIRTFDKGRILAYVGSRGIHRLDFRTGEDKVWEMPTASSGSPILDRTGRYLYSLSEGTPEVSIRRLDLTSGSLDVVGKLPTSDSDEAQMPDAFGDRVLFYTTLPLSDEGGPKGRNVYVYDCSTQQFKLQSKKADGSAVNDGLRVRLIWYPMRTAIFSQSGKEIVYPIHTLDPLPAGLIWPTPPHRVYVQEVGGSPRALVSAISSGGSNGTTRYVPSRNNTAVLYSALDPSDHKTRRVLVRGSDDRGGAHTVASGLGSSRAIDVSDDGRYSVYQAPYDEIAPFEDSNLYVYDRKTGETSNLTQSLPAKFHSRLGMLAKVDPKGQVYFLHPTDPNYDLAGIKLYRFDVASKNLVEWKSTPGAIFWTDQYTYPSLALGAGQIAFATTDRVLTRYDVFDLESGALRGTTTIDAPYNGLEMWLTNDRRRIQIGNGLFEIASGKLLKGGLVGKINPAGDWTVTDSSDFFNQRRSYRATRIGQATYLPTGATFSLAPYLAGLGNPAGPVTFSFDRNGLALTLDLINRDEKKERGFDLVRYRASVPNFPTMYDYRATSGRGRFSIYSQIQKAGLENAETWLEVRVAGGDWQRYATESVPAPNGARGFDVRARDALGRTSPIEHFDLVSDSVAPVLSHVEASVGADRAKISFDLDELSSVQLKFGETTEMRSEQIKTACLPGRQAFELTDLKPKTTYYYKITASDRSYNLGDSGDRTFTTP